MKNSGKIQHSLFHDIILKNCGFEREEVRTGPGFGVDVAVIELPGNLSLITASDPLSLIPSLGLEESAWLSVYLMANDICTTGFSPMYGQFVLNLPAQMTADDFKTYWDHIHRLCKKLGIAITGGHTGFIEGQNSTIAGGGTLMSIAPKADVLVSKNAKAGNVILVTKECAISSTAILAMSFPETVKNILGKEVFNLACELFYQSSSVQDALLAVGGSERNDAVTAMHDVTEGGVLGAIYELAIASGNGAIVNLETLPIGHAQKEIGRLFDFDPMHAIGAGSMIISVEKGREQGVINRLKQEQIACTKVGELVEKKEGIKVVGINGIEDMAYTGQDPYWNAFFKAQREGWK